jgi:polygalacturonase
MNYGAVADGTTDNTAAFASAISACANAGGGVVEIPAGTYVSGAIQLQSNINLQVDSGATIMFTSDVTKYPQVVTRFEGVELMNNSPMIYAYGANNVAITGTGVLDGTNTQSWNVFAGSAADDLFTWSNSNTPVTWRTLPSGDTLPVAMIEPYDSTNVLISGVTVQNGAWTQFHPTLCTNVTINGAVPADTDDVGLSLESNVNVIVANMTIVSGGDAISLKSGADNDGRRTRQPSSNVVANNVTFALASGTDGSMISVGPEMAGGVYNTYAYNLSTTGVNGRVLGMRSNGSQGGVANNINLDTVSTSALNDDVAYLTFNDDSDASWAGPTGFNPVFSNITISNSSIGGFPEVVDMDGMDTDTSITLSLVNDTFTNTTNNPDNIADGTVVCTNTTLNGVAMAQ